MNLPSTRIYYFFAIGMLASCAERSNSDGDAGERDPPAGFLRISAAIETPVLAGVSDCDFDEPPLKLYLSEATASDVGTIEVRYDSTVLTLGPDGRDADVYLGACFEAGEVRLATWVAESGPFGMKEVSRMRSALIDVSGLPVESGDTIVVFNEPSGSQVEVEIP